MRTSSAWSGLLNTPAITQLPHYAAAKSLPEDGYYTDRGVARHCLEQLYRVCDEQGVHLGNYTFIEPSAGEGCFYSLFPGECKRLALDINPRHRDIKKADFLSWYPATDGKYIVVGNPPFGHRGATALGFINRSFLFAEMVAFILPMSFYSNGKGTNMKRVRGAALLHSEKLKPDSFYLPGTKESVAVNTVFQVWRRGKTASVFNDYDVSEYADIYTCCSAPSRYCRLGRGRKYDCFIASTFYGDKIGIVHDFNDVLYGSGYGIVIKKEKPGVLKALREAEWGNGYCSDATNSCKHIRMFHVRKLLGEAGYGTRRRQDRRPGKNPPAKQAREQNPWSNGCDGIQTGDNDECTVAEY